MIERLPHPYRWRVSDGTFIETETIMCPFVGLFTDLVCGRLAKSSAYHNQANMLILYPKMGNILAGVCDLITLFAS
jgi:hypothetical protein